MCWNYGRCFHFTIKDNQICSLEEWEVSVMVIQLRWKDFYCLTVRHFWILLGVNDPPTACWKSPRINTLLDLNCHNLMFMCGPVFVLFTSTVGWQGGDAHAWLITITWKGPEDSCCSCVLSHTLFNYWLYTEFHFIYQLYWQYIHIACSSMYSIRYRQVYTRNTI